MNTFSISDTHSTKTNTKSRIGIIRSLEIEMGRIPSWYTKQTARKSTGGKAPRKQLAVAGIVGYVAVIIAAIIAINYFLSRFEFSSSRR